MNIFYLDEDMEQCAQAHFDCHVIKMILESAQILCTVCSYHGVVAPYRPTHKKHPCTIWASESLDNWQWLRKFCFALDAEYRYRFDHLTPHKSIGVVSSLYEPDIISLGITARPQVMPPEYRIIGNPIAAYRSYYAAEKIHLFKYTKRKPPAWLGCTDVMR